jgi:chemotaxis protein CheZ
MAVRRKIFRIEEMAGSPLKPRTDDSHPPLHSDVVEELSALRAILGAAARPQSTDTSLTRPGERLARELHIVLAILGAASEKPSGRNGMKAQSTQIVCELEAVAQGCEQATQKILAAAEDIDAAANNLSAALKDTCEQGLAQDIRDRVIQIFEACNFQDLTSQRVAKVMATLSRLERHIAGALARSDAAPPVHGPRLPGEPGHVSQSDVDTMFVGETRSA